MEATTPVERFGPLSRISYAQNMEDILLDRVFRGKPGTFVDIGANHPFVDNNSYFFYVRGWRGINIEPMPAARALFETHRPDDLNLALAVSDEEGTLPFFEVSNENGANGLSTLDRALAKDHQAQGFEVTEIQVPVRTVASLVAEYRIDPPDFLSIDVEGHEDAVIRGIPFATWRPKILVIESTRPLSSVETHATWEPALLEHGYVFATFNGLNRFYLREDQRSELPCFATPVSTVDRFERQDVVAWMRKAEHFRDLYEREQADRAFERAHFEEMRAGWEWGRIQSRYIHAVCEQEIARIANERETWGARLEEFERERAAWANERAAHERTRRELESLLADASRQLRPYRLIDRLGVVTSSYRLAQRVKRRLAS
jgi:FkbM family methyltransferase